MHLLFPHFHSHHPTPNHKHLYIGQQLFPRWSVCLHLAPSMIYSPPSAQSFSKMQLLPLHSWYGRFRYSTLIARSKHKLDKMACLDPKYATLQVLLTASVPLSSGHTVHQTVSDPRPLHKLFPLPGVSTAHFGEVSAHMPLLQRSFPDLILQMELCSQCYSYLVLWVFSPL